MSINHRSGPSGSRPRRLSDRPRAVAAVVALAAVLTVPGWSGLAAPRPVVPPREPGAALQRSVAAQRPGAAAQGSQVLPVAGQAAVAPPRVVAKAAILADEATGQVLFERNAGAGRAMASTTKVMTALLTLERLDEDRAVVIGAGPPKVGEESLRLRTGERLTVRQLLLGLLVKSANDAAVALAEAVDGSEAAFVRRMNRKAAALRLTATHYVTPYGLDRPGHQTSARDLGRLWEVAMRRADFRALVATRAARIPGGPLSLRRFVTTNQLLGTYRWTVGGKTGFTNRAGRCLVASASRGGRRLVAVAMGTPNAFADVRALFEYGFSKYVRARLAQRGQPVSERAAGPAGSGTDADVDALVRLDQLDQVRLALAPGAATAWFTAGGRRLAPVRLAPLPLGGPTAPTTMVAPAPAAAAGTDPAAALLTAGAVVRVRPVPPGAPAPTIDPTLRRAPP
jgi:D-alanyl-D-alanine carboxypeptidase (penicillin-binding protein 5/6)